MIHIEEHILELFVLGSTKIESRRQEIESHLNGCAACRALADEMKSFYAEADIELHKLQSTDTSTQRALARSKRSVVPFEEKFSAPAPFAHVTPMGRFRYFVYKHPFVAGGGALAFGAAGVLAANLLVRSPIKDTNPVKYQYNFKDETLCVYNKEDEKLWQLPSEDILLTLKDSVHDQPMKGYTAIQDLDSDGTNEVLTAVNIAGEFETYRPLRIYNADKTLRKLIRFKDSIHYLDRNYTPGLGVNGLFAGAITPGGTSEIFVVASNHNSPSFLVRLDNKGNEIGKYWHFGGLNGFDTVDIDGSGKRKLIVRGINDIDDGTHQEFGVIIVLDPSKIIGESKSTATPGYKMAVSNAEEYYVRFPRSDLDDILRSHPVPARTRLESDNTLKFFVFSDAVDGYNVFFEYIFSRDMRVVQVKSNNGTDRVYAELAGQGKFTGSIDHEYLDRLKNGVRYWDGKQWRKEVVRVRHEDGLSIVKGQ